MARWIALLKAVNVAGTGRLEMAPFVQACAAQELRGARSWAAAGNLLFEDDRDRATLASLLEGQLAAFGVRRGPPVLRRAEELAAVVAGNPFPHARPGALHVHFLDAPGQPLAWPGPERVRVAGADVYIDYEAGVGRSKLTVGTLDRLTGQRGTARNWNTVTKLLALAGA